MKTKNVLLIAALASALMLAAGCKKGGETKAEDPSIKVAPEQIEAGWEGKIASIDVTANCAWNISKTDAEGSAVDWVKCDRANGNGSLKLQVKVEKNPYGKDRNATVTLFCNDVKAFIDVRQEANPDPESDPDPKPKYLELSFDFTVDGLNWPTSKEDSWAELKNFDSGCATDNGGTATDNHHRRAQVTYPLNGTNYDFTFADPNESNAHNIYLSTGKGVYSGTLRYFGLPVIEGKKLVKIEMVQNASTKTTEGWHRDVGVTEWVYHKDVDINKDIHYVDGGEPQNQNVNGETYTYELSGTAPNHVYWLNSPTNASIIKSLKLYYADVIGNEPDPSPEPKDPTPADPGEGGEGGDVVISPNALRLSFDFTGEPLTGWPTAAKYTHQDGGIECIYPLNGVNYVFVPADCDGASAGQAFWQPPVPADGETPAKAGYFALNAQYRYLGLPAIQNYTLVQVVCHSCQLGTVTAAAKMGITKSIAKSAAHPAASEFMAGGDYQSWEATGGDYTYTLSNTLPATRYYIYANAKGAIATLDLVYNPSNQ